MTTDKSSEPAKPLDDPRLQELFSSAISGALAFGAQGVNPPPEGHWLALFWNMARAERSTKEPAPADDVLEALGLDPALYRSESGSINAPKLRATIRFPADYLPESHWMRKPYRYYPPPDSGERIKESLPTTTDKSAEREAFERDAEPYGVVLDRASCGCCDYENIDTETRWKGWQARAALPQQAQDPQAWLDVLAERRRQVEVERWTELHDDDHDAGELSAAGASYAIAAADELLPLSQGDGHFTAGNPPTAWPWDYKWWKPSEPRRMLVKAGALILAEIERLDRAAIAKGERHE